MGLIASTLLVSQLVFADKVKLLEDNNEALQARVDLIQNAKREILVEYFEVASDELSLTGLSLLRQAAERGVKVKILIDSMHNSLNEAEMAAMMGISESSKANENIEIRVFNPLHTINPLHLTYRNHDKLLNVDGEMMIVGGRNVAKTYFGKSKEFNFKDADALVVGEHTTKESYDYFMTLWSMNPDVKKVNLNRFTHSNLTRSCPGEASDACELDQRRAIDEITRAKNKMDDYLLTFKEGKAWVQAQPLDEMLKDLEDIKTIKFAFNDPTKSMKNVENKLSNQIMNSFSINAKNEILIVTPYLYPTEKELQTLEQVAASGVKIKIVTNSLASTDTALVHAAFLSIKQRLINLGAEIYLFKGPEILHCKGVVIDRKISMIGSFNFDRRSALINREIGIRVGSPDENTPQFTKEFLAFINEEIISNSVLLAKDKQEFSTPEVDSLVTEKRQKELDHMKNYVKLLSNQI